VAKSLDRSGQVVALAGDIIRSKALDVLVEHANIRSKDVSSDGDAASEPQAETTEPDPAPGQGETS
jgi:hypothetical protein